MYCSCADCVKATFSILLCRVTLRDPLAMPLHRIPLLLLLFLHLSLALPANQSSCLGGQIHINDRCDDCPAGTYREADAANKCNMCPPGTYNPLTGVGSLSLCRLCPQDTFAPEAGAIACQPCPRDTAAQFGAKECKACGPGFRLRSDNRCTKCDEGTYNSKTAALECVFCENGSSPRGATSANDCKPCPQGLRPTISGCLPCIEGTFVSSMMCKFCPRGTVAKPGATKCEKCPPGTFSRRFFQRDCLKCPPGFTSNGPGASRCRPVGSTKCPKGSFENANGDCDKCRQGYFVNVKTRMCERCAPGFVSNGGVRTECDPCLPSQTTDEFHGAACICPRGQWRAKSGGCKKCPPGTGGNFENVFGRDGCIKCNPGYFSDKRGSTECKPCPIGTIAAQEGSSKCTPCPLGSTSEPQTMPFQSLGAARCVSPRTGCPLGTIPARDIFDRRTCSPKFCQVGTPTEEIGISCTSCSPGQFLKNGQCVPCELDEVSPGGIITSCKKCESGLVRSFFDDSKCACDGDVGEGKGIQDGVCKDCPPGTYSTANFSECVPCRPGFFAKGSGNASCRRCPAGTFSDTAGSAMCKKCPRGTKASTPTGATECIPSD